MLEQLPGSRVLEEENCRAGKHQCHAACKHDDQRELAFDRAKTEPVCHLGLLFLASRSALELISSFTFCAASGLTSNLSWASSSTRLIMPPASRNGSPSPTVSTGDFF